jgi:hypothetical protein
MAKGDLKKAWQAADKRAAAAVADAKCAMDYARTEAIMAGGRRRRMVAADKRAAVMARRAKDEAVAAAAMAERWATEALIAARLAAERQARMTADLEAVYRVLDFHVAVDVLHSTAIDACS